MPLAPDLPAPVLLEDGQTLPKELPSPQPLCGGADCATPSADGLGNPERPGDPRIPGSNGAQEPGNMQAGAPITPLPAAAPLVPPPPLLPPPPLR